MRCERGFAAIVAMAIIVIAGIFAAALARISTETGVEQGFDLLGAKALNAARAGLEYGAWQASKASTTWDCATPAAYDLTLQGKLSGFGVHVVCTSSTYTEGAGPAFVSYQIVATACNRASCPGTPQLGYVERQLKMTLSLQ